MDKTPTDNVFSINEAEILQEVMNIAFGKASSDLAEVIDIRVVLNVPHVELLKAVDLPPRIKDEIRVYDLISIIEQNFWGKFKGSALLVFPAKAGKGLTCLFDEDESSGLEDNNALLQKETLLEVGNILIGACVGKVAELLDDIVSFSPPRIIINNLSSEAVSKKLSDPDKLAILMKTVFHFEDKDISGFLFLITSQDSIKWLKAALQNFMEKF